MRALCISPHVDDVEYGMAGTILKHTTTQFDILEMIPENEARFQEAKQFWAPVPNCNVLFSELNFAHGVQEREWIKYLGGFFPLDSYDTLYIPPHQDSHFEHRLSNRIGIALMRASRAAIIEYRTPSTFNTWAQNMFVDVSSTYEKKAELLTIFESQRHCSYFEPDCIRAFHSNYQCVKRGLPLVEQFKVLTLYV